MLDTPLPSCRHYHPAGANSRFSQASTVHPVFALRKRARPPESPTFEATLCSLSLRPDDSLTSPRIALSMGFRPSVSLLPAIQATGLLASTQVGLTPTERVSLRWTHIRTSAINAYGSSGYGFATRTCGRFSDSATDNAQEGGGTDPTAYPCPANAGSATSTRHASPAGRSG